MMGILRLSTHATIAAVGAAVLAGATLSGQAPQGAGQGTPPASRGAGRGTQPAPPPYDFPAGFTLEPAPEPQPGTADPGVMFTTIMDRPEVRILRVEIQPGAVRRVHT